MHYNIKSSGLPKEHQDIIALEFETSFRQWFFDHPEFSSYTAIPVELLNSFFIWCLGYLDRMANTAGKDQTIWIHRCDAVRTTEGTMSMEQTKSGPGLSGTATSHKGGDRNPSLGKTREARAEDGNIPHNSQLSPPAHMTDSWITMGKGGKVQSFASIAATATPTPPHTTSTPQTSPQTNLPPRFNANLSRAQVEAMTKAQIVSLLRMRFQVMP